ARERSQQQIQSAIGKALVDIPDMRFWFLKDDGQRDVSFVIAGPDQALINETANKLASEMRSIPFLDNPMSTAELDRPELQITPRRQLAADLGVSTEALAETIRVATLGDADANLAKFDAGDRQLPIRVRLADAARSDMGLLQS
ncbi:efflux RND transporter permease subunit, partial [Mycobacterium tuberculosis]|nr:efflux RND transporter permease subunit [Mycobacterium tuberculosis]